MTQLTIGKTTLAQALGVVTRAVSSRATLAALGTVLLKSENGRLRLSATNLEMGLSCWLDAGLDGDLAIALPARTFSDMVNALEGGSEVHIHANGECKATLKSGGSKTILNGMAEADFPPLPDSDGAETRLLPAGEFKEAVRQVAIAASTDDVRPILQGVLVEIEPSRIRLVATDGFRLAIRTLVLPQSSIKQGRYIIPASAMKELARLLPDEPSEFTLASLNNRAQLAFRAGDLELVTQLLEGNFPDYTAILPKSTKLKVTVATQELLKACKQAEIIARAGGHIAKFTFAPGVDGKGSLVISAQSEETGSSEIQVPLQKFEGPGLTIAFNVRLIKDVLEVLKSKEVIFEANTHKTSAAIKPLNGEEYLYLVMPMHQG